MERLQRLERVLAAAERVLEMREYEMLTHCEWDALKAAIAEAKTDATVPTEKIPVQILFEDGLMLVWDDDGDGIECHEMGSGPATEVQATAERQIDLCAEKYAFDVAEIKRALADYVSEI